MSSRIALASLAMSPMLMPAPSQDSFAPEGLRFSEQSGWPEIHQERGPPPARAAPARGRPDTSGCSVDAERAPAHVTAGIVGVLRCPGLMQGVRQRGPARETAVHGGHET